MKSYSLVEAKGNMAKIVREVEQGGPVELTQVGQSVVVVLSIKKYARLMAEQRLLFNDEDSGQDVPLQLE